MSTVSIATTAYHPMKIDNDMHHFIGIEQGQNLATFQGEKNCGNSDTKGTLSGGTISTKKCHDQMLKQENEKAILWQRG